MTADKRHRPTIAQEALYRAAEAALRQANEDAVSWLSDVLVSLTGHQPDAVKLETRQRRDTFTFDALFTGKGNERTHDDDEPSDGSLWDMGDDEVEVLVAFYGDFHFITLLSDAVQHRLYDSRIELEGWRADSSLGPEFSYGNHQEASDEHRTNALSHIALFIRFVQRKLEKGESAP